MCSCRIVDTTMRDGEQRSGIYFSLKEKLELAILLDSLKVYQIEAGIPAMGGEEKKSVAMIKELNLRSRISAWNRLNIEDVRNSIDCGVDIIHIAVPASELHMKKKLNKSKEWVQDNLKKCIYLCKSKDFTVSIGFEDASRGDKDFMKVICGIALQEGAERIRLADTVGILTPRRTFKLVKEIKDNFNIDIEIHTHNDFGMAVANSLAAVKAGAEYVDCTLNGIGERAGNCDYYKFNEALEAWVSGEKEFVYKSLHLIKGIELNNEQDRMQ